jgi:hypothetical protein
MLPSLREPNASARVEADMALTGVGISGASSAEKGRHKMIGSKSFVSAV